MSGRIRSSGTTRGTTIRESRLRIVFSLRYRPGCPSNKRSTRVKFSQFPFIDQNDKGKSTRTAILPISSSRFFRIVSGTHFLVVSQRASVRDRRNVVSLGLGHLHPSRIPKYTIRKQSHPRITLQCAATHRHGPSQWTSFGTSSSDQLDLFYFLNIYRCSAAEPSSLTSSTIRKAAALHAHITISLFFMGRARQQPRTSLTLLYLPPHSSIHIIITYSSMRIHVSSLYIYVYILLYYYLRAYIYMNTLPHARTHTHTHYIAICVLVYIHIYTQLHIYYIIVLYVSEKERPVDYGRSAFLMSE